MSQRKYFEDFDLEITLPQVTLLHSVDSVRPDTGKVANPNFQLLIGDEDIGRIEILVKQTGQEAGGRAGVSGTYALSEQLEGDVSKIGKRLFDSLLPRGHALHESFIISNARIKERQKEDQAVNTRVRLRIDPELSHIPWEAMYTDPQPGQALAQAVSVVRSPLTKQERLGIHTVYGPLNILLVGVSPDPQEMKRLNDQKKVIQEALKELIDGEVRLIELPQDEPSTTLSALDEYFSQGETDIHVLHFMGHGYYDANERVGRLVMLKNGQRFDYKGSDIAKVIAKGANRGLRLVVLNACESAASRPSGQSLQFTDVAWKILSAGVPAVLAMQYEISDPAARLLASTFYGQLGETWSVDEAVRVVRNELSRQITGTLEWITPVLFLEGDGHLFELRPPKPVVPATFKPHYTVEQLVLLEPLKQAFEDFLEGRETDPNRSKHILHYFGGPKNGGKTSLVHHLQWIAYGRGYAPLFLGSEGGIFVLDNERRLGVAKHIYREITGCLGEETPFHEFAKVLESNALNQGELGKLLDGMQAASQGMAGVICFLDFHAGSEHVEDLDSYKEVWNTLLTFSAKQRQNKDPWPGVAFVVTSSGRSIFESHWKEQGGLKWNVKECEMKEWQKDDFIALCRKLQFRTNGTEPDDEFISGLFCAYCAQGKPAWPGQLETWIKLIMAAGSDDGS